jgi:hypothetical protein
MEGKTMKASRIVFAAALVLAGCRVNETKDAEGDKKYEVEPAKVEVGSEEKTVTVPTVEVKPDSTKPDTTKPR